jgi:lipopolysaccharide biosynthesis glycosyltransferase
MVSDNTSYPFDFLCLSDTVVKDLPTLQLTESIEHEGVWNKLRLFTNKELQSYNTKIYFDLDVVIHGNIDSLFTLNTNFLNVLRSISKN